MAPVNRKIVHTVFEETVRRFPQREAVHQAGNGISYRDLSRASNEIAAMLRRAGVGRDVIVGVPLESGIAYVAAIIGVMKAGGLFLPLDLSLPDRRLEYMLRKTPPRVVIADAAFEETGRRLAAAGFDDRACPVVLLGRDLHPTIQAPERGGAMGISAAEAGGLPDPDDGCYIMYTSGSTGVPKAIEGCYKSLSHFVHWEAGEFGFDENIRVTQLPPITFDASLRDIFVPLITGGTLCIPEKGARSNMKELLRWMEEEEITLVHCVPSLFRMMTRELEERDGGVDREILPALRYILMAGEPLYGKDVIRWMDRVGERVTLVNLYGPSETTLVKTFFPIGQRPANPNAMIPAGRPIANTAVLILKGGRLCEPGEIGDIFIKTPFRTKGYYGDPELTGMSFVPNPLTGDSEDIVYKTGDIGRYLTDRTIEFIGRLDTQVKVNGIRIELGEIEKTLMGGDFIDQTVVVSHRSPDNENTLVCYYTEKRATDAGQISAWLQRSLPSYMVPSFYVRLDEFPLNINGKIDRKALPKPEELIYEEIPYEAPANEREETLARIWGEVLHLKKVGVNSPFFRIGGHSLTATRLLARIYREMEVEISLRTFFANQTIRSLAALLKERPGSDFAGIAPLEPQPDYAVSPSQRRLWVLDRMEEGSVAYNLPGLYRVEGNLDVPALEKAFHALIDRHESLRTTFFATEGEPRQKIRDTADFLAGFSVERIDLTGAADAEERAIHYARAQAVLPFDLSRGPLLRIAVLTLTPGRHAIFFNIHHIIGDAWSFDILERDLMALYGAFREGRPNPLAPLRVQYRDYAAWLNARLAADETSKMAHYWHEKLAGAGSSPLDLPSDDVRPLLQTYRGKTSFFDLDERLTAGLAELARKHDASLFMILLALVKTLLHRYTGREDIIVGSPVACRNHPDLQDQIGFYANTLALRDDLRPDDSFAAVIEKVKRTVIDAYDHQQYPFDRLVDELGLERDPGRAPLFDVMLVYRDGDGRVPTERDRLRMTAVEVESGTCRFDLTFEVEPSAGGLRVGINYNTDLFRAATIERIASHVATLAEGVLVDASAEIGTLEILGPAEKRRLTESFNDTRHPYPADKTIVDLFEAMAAEKPDRTAVVLEDGELSYRELNERARGLAATLVAKYRIEPGETVGLMVDRGEWSVVGLLGILMAGGVYLPVDPAYPKERIHHMLEDSGCRVLLVQRALDEAIRPLPASAEALKIECIAPPYDPSGPAEALSRRSSPDSPAYIIYTSGSTGQPKGVLIEHSGFVNMALHQIRVFEVSETDRVLQFASASFDASLSEIFMALLAGAAVVTVAKETIYDPLAFVRYLEEKRVSHVTLPPIYLSVIDKERLHTVKTIITAGEAPNAGDAVFLSRTKRYFNAYGPTEFSVCATIERVSPEGDYRKSVPIGRPIANAAVYILDGSLNLVPIGVPGEICLSGPGLARGYLNRPELTAERFVAHPFRANERLYRTGDIGRWLPNGTIEWLGRNDDQVKIRGYRIELGEVRNALLRHAAVKEAVVLAAGRDSKELVAYFTTTGPLEPADLRSHLGRFLPGHMMPHYLIQMDALPLTVHGKVDRKALPDPGSTGRRPDDVQVHPRNDLEKRLLVLWREIIGRPDIGIHDNFFESGGNSLRSLQLISRISTELDVKVPVKLLFLNPTVAGLTAAIERQKPMPAVRAFASADAPQPFSPAMTIERRPLMSLFDAGGIGPVDAAAIICLPDDLIDQTGLGKDEIIKGFCNNRPILSSITSTFLGRIASIVLPRFASEIFSDKASLRNNVAEALEMAGHIGAKTVSLTGHLPLATDDGFDVVEHVSANHHHPSITTGHATVAAAMAMTLEKTLRLSGRHLEDETVGLVGLNTIGAATLCLLLECMPHPKKIILADAYNNLLFAAVLSRELVDCGIREGALEIMKASDELPPPFYESSLIIGATNVPEIIDVARIKPGTIIVEESGQRCFATERAVQRIETDGDILFTEGDLLRLPAPATCLLYLPEAVEMSLRETKKLSLLAFKPRTITGCVLSGLLSHLYADLKPTIGEVDGETALRHYRLLHQLGFGVVGLRCEDYRIQEEKLRRFKRRFGMTPHSLGETICEEGNMPTEDEARA